MTRLTIACAAWRSSPSRREKQATKLRERVAARGMGRREGKETHVLKPALFQVYYSFLQPPEAAYFYWLKRNYSYNLVKSRRHVIDCVQSNVSVKKP